MGKLEEAIADYQIATTRGTKYLSSTCLTSDPSPGAKAEWFRTSSRFHNCLGIAYAKAGKYEDALVEFEKAIGAAGGSVKGVGVIDQVVGTILGEESEKRQEFAKVVGAYCYNVGIMEEKLGRSSSEAMERARQLDYDRTLIVELK